MTASSGNGDPPRRHAVSSTDFYDACRRQVEEMFPRAVLVRLFDQIESCLRLLPPEDIAERVDGSTWLLSTQEGADLPEIDIFFTYDDGTVVLEAALPEL